MNEIRKHNPIVKQIPDIVWHAYFARIRRNEKSLPLDWLNKPLNQLTEDELLPDPKQTFILILVNYPEIPISELINFAKNILQLSILEIMGAVASMGNLDAFILMKQQEPEAFQELIQREDHNIFFHALENKDRAMLQWLRQNAPESWAHLMQNYYVTWCDDLDMLIWLKGQSPEEFINEIDDGAFRYAARKGHVAILEWFKEQVPNKILDMIRNDEYTAFNQAALEGHLEVLKWMKKQIPLSTADSFLMLFSEKAYSEPLDMVKAIDLESVVGNHHAHVLQWLIEQDSKVLNKIKTDDVFRKALSSSFLNGALHPILEQQQLLTDCSLFWTLWLLPSETCCLVQKLHGSASSGLGVKEKYLLQHVNESLSSDITFP